LSYALTDTRRHIEVEMVWILTKTLALKQTMRVCSRVVEMKYSVEFIRVTVMLSTYTARNNH